MYPNPSKKFMVVKRQINFPAMFKIYDVAGRPALTGTLGQQNEVFDISALKLGVYILKPEFSKTQRLIVE